MDAATLLLFTAVFYLVVKRRLATYMDLALTPTPGQGFNPAAYKHSDSK